MQEKAGIRVVESWEFVTGYCWKQHPSAFAVVQDGVEQPGLAGAEEAGQQVDGQAGIAVGRGMEWLAGWTMTGT
jgi:hypothetical protein